MTKWYVYIANEWLECSPFTAAVFADIGKPVRLI
jgi:hypothetical protein